jgi:hypothetical protein
VELQVGHSPTRKDMELLDNNNINDDILFLQDLNDVYSRVISNTKAALLSILDNQTPEFGLDSLELSSYRDWIDIQYIINDIHDLIHRKGEIRMLEYENADKVDENIARNTLINQIENLSKQLQIVNEERRKEIISKSNILNDLRESQAIINTLQIEISINKKSKYDTEIKMQNEINHLHSSLEQSEQQIYYLHNRLNDVIDQYYSLESEATALKEEINLIKFK